MSPEDIQEIQALALQGMSIRAIARKLGRDRHTIRKALGSPPPPPATSKLKPFQDKILELVKHNLTAPRILREIRAVGYTGGKTILSEFLRKHRPPTKKLRKVFRRFETPPGKEAQVDWSPYRLRIGEMETVAHCFSLVMAHSRYLWIGFYRNERLPSLLDAHLQAFSMMGGCPRTIFYDNQTQVTLGRRQGKPIWNPAFLEFAKHYGFEPRVCRPRDPNRKGKVERPFSWIEKDLLRGAAFKAWDDLNAQARAWLDTVANVRVHSTTHRKVDEMFAQEKPLLIALPSLAYPTDRREVRKVAIDGTVAIDGSYYPVPAHLVGQYVTVKVYPNHIEVLDAAQQVAVSHRIPIRPTRVAPERTEFTPPHECVSRTALETAFLARFPNAAKFLDGLHARMKSLLPIHLRQIERLVELYGQPNVTAALDRAQRYGNYSALALGRILERTHPNIVSVPPIWMNLHPAAMEALDGVDTSSPTEYTLDTQAPTEETPHET